MAGDATATEAAHSCKPGFKSCPRKQCRSNRLLGYVQIDFSKPPLIVIAGEIISEMCMCIHEPRTKRRITKIDDPCAARDRQIVSRIYNFVLLHDDDGVLHKCIRFAVENACGFERE